MYWSGDLGYRDADGWIFLAGRTADWMRVDGENMAAAPIERIILRLPEVSQVAVYPVPDEHVGDQVMAAVVLAEGTALAPDSFGDFLALQSDLSPKAWPRYVWIADELPATATNKVLKRELVARGANPEGGQLWTRAAPGPGLRARGGRGIGPGIAAFGQVTVNLAYLIVDHLRYRFTSAIQGFSRGRPGDRRMKRTP